LIVVTFRRSQESLHGLAIAMNRGELCGMPDGYLATIMERGFASRSG
jgi:hypothetical protein